MAVRTETCRLAIGLSVIYWLVVVGRAIDVVGDEATRTYAEMGGLDTSPAAEAGLRLLGIARQSGVGEAAVIVGQYGIAYALLGVMFLIGRWIIVRGHRRASPGRREFRGR